MIDLYKKFITGNKQRSESFEAFRRSEEQLQAIYGTRWVYTKHEAAEALGITPEAVVDRAKRLGLKRRTPQWRFTPEDLAVLKRNRKEGSE